MATIPVGIVCLFMWGRGENFISQKKNSYNSGVYIAWLYCGMKVQMEIEGCMWKVSSQVSNLLPLGSKFTLICLFLDNNEGGVCKLLLCPLAQYMLILPNRGRWMDMNEEELFSSWFVCVLFTRLLVSTLSCSPCSWGEPFLQLPAPMHKWFILYWVPSRTRSF